MNLFELEFQPYRVLLKNWHSKVERRKMLGQEVRGELARKQGADLLVWVERGADVRVGRRALGIGCA